MARYILIDNDTGYIFGDSADLNGCSFSGPPVEFAAVLDASLGQYNRKYEWLGYNPAMPGAGYHVYRADIDGSEAIAVIHDGQSQEEIDAVERDCLYVGFIRITD